MKEKTTITILGYGARGKIYGEIALKNPETMQVVAVCDINSKKLQVAQNTFNLKSSQLFSNYKDLFSCGKLSDILVVSTMDGDHKEQTIPALELGYNILLEKPISPNAEDCLAVASAAKKYERIVAVCHVLRYTPFYGKVKELVDSGKIGKVITVTQTENVGYWHQAHSFVRGNWRNSLESSPMILQKCCHDLDIIKWLVGEECKTISSFGALNYFKAENAPKNAAKHCVDCPVKDCVFNCFDFYSTHADWAGMICPSGENLTKILSDKTNLYSRCVFACDNNVVDHQVVNMQFSTATAQLTMTAFSKDCHRSLHIFGTFGEIFGDMEENTISVNIFGKGGNSSASEVIDVKTLCDDFSYHGGGDRRMLEDFARECRGETSGGLNTIQNALNSHLMAFAAEESRLKNGAPVEIKGI